MKTCLTDNDEMPWGIHKGKTMANVPSEYFLFLWRNKKLTYGDVYDYVKDNMDGLLYDEKQKGDKV
jgi:uncharacterized protein (DUF3820 family)